MVFSRSMPSSGLLGHMIVLFLVFKRISILFSIMSVSIYIPTNNAKGCPCLHTLFIIYCLQILWHWPFWLVWGNTSLLFWFVSANISDVEYLFMGFIFSCASWPSVKWSEVAQLCLTLCDPMDYSLPGSSIHGIFQARILEWGAISLSRGSSQPKGIRYRSPTLQADSLLSEPPGNKPVSWKKLSALTQEYHGLCLPFLSFSSWTFI